MPWHIEKRDEKFCVIKDSDGENEGCHDSREKAQAQMRALYASERSQDYGVELRAANITGVDSRQRLIDLIAVPWEQEAEVMWRGEVWREVFTRGAFDGIEEHAGRVRVNREHHVGDTIGKVVQFTNEPDGLHARVKVANTPRGDETLSLAEEDMISASVGFRVKKPSDVQTNNRTRMRRVVRAFLDHLAMVESPAYAGAQVLAVREGSGTTGDGERLHTPALDEAMNDPIVEWARSQVESRKS
jgi:HK97 family phage prohead protease